MKKPAIAVLGSDPGPWQGVRRWLVLGPHPDDFDAVAVTLRRLSGDATDLFLDVLTSGASGVEDVFAATWEGKTSARENEQRASCRLFGLDGERLRFHRFAEDQTGHMLDNSENEKRIREILEGVCPDGVVLPHGNDTNADHRRTFRFFESWAGERQQPVLALLIRDPKTIGMRLDLVMPFGAPEAEWKAKLLRCHASQQERNIHTRGHGFDERILQVNREIAKEAGIEEEFAEGFEIATYGGINQR
jgi:LmbE family N-acetylglucosaminyl deacetylase